MVSMKKVISGMFDLAGDFKKDPIAAIIMCVAMLLAISWWALVVLPISIPLASLKDWSKTPGKSFWEACKDNFRGPV